MADPNILLDAFKLKPAAAIDYIKRKGNAFSWNWHDLWKDAHARAFTVAKVAKLDLLTDIRGMVEKAISDGITLQQFKNELTPQLQKHGWWGKKQHTNEDTGEVTEWLEGSPRRLKTIYQTNLQTAYMAGRYKGQMDAAADMPYMQYIAVLDGKTTDKCREMDGRIFRADDPVWDAMYPPNHWGCRSRVRSLSEKQAERMGARVESSEGRIVEREVTVGKGDTARTAKVTGLKMANGETFWTGAGWDYNAAKEAWMPDLSAYNDNEARAFVKDSFAGPAYRAFLDAKGKTLGEIPVAVLPPKYAGDIGAKANVVQLSADTLREHEHHPEITTDDYLRLQEIIEQAQTVLLQSTGKTLAFIERGGKYYFATIKATKRGDALYLTSLRLTNPKDIEKAKSKALRIIKDGL